VDVRSKQRFQLKPQRLVGDTAYGTGSMLGWMVEEKRIEPHVPVWDKTQRKDDTFSSRDFESANCALATCSPKFFETRHPPSNGPLAS
jgi:hypothetical protein